MSALPQITTGSLRAVRLRARLPRVVAGVLVAVLCAAGIRVIVAGPPRPVAVRTVAPPTGDQGATSYAEAFARAYLTFDAADRDARERALAALGVTTVDADAGVQPGAGRSQEVAWTAVLGDRRDGRRRLVTVMAQLDHGAPVYLTVPVTRDAHGFLAIAGYPAIVGPPATATRLAQPTEADVDDAGLQAVVTRALTNYLAGNRRNLLADLTPDAVVSLPNQRLRVDRVDGVTWVVPARRVAVEVQARDAGGTSWTLRYELDVQQRDRWFVRSLQVDPTFQGGS